MENTSKTTTQNADVAALIENTLAMQAAVAPEQEAFEEKLKKREARDKDESKMFRRFKIKDIVFLAIITACTLVTSAIMPLLIHVPVFGIIQLGLGLQFSIFPVIGLMKVRKAGSMTIMGVFIALFLVMMFPPMALIAVCVRWWWSFWYLPFFAVIKMTGRASWRARCICRLPCRFSGYTTT